MRKIIMLTMLTFLVCCVTMLFVGCENGNLEKNKPESGKNDTLYDSGEKIYGIVGNDFKEEKEEVYKYNETGKIIIVMYHKFAEEEKDEWTRSYENFYQDLL